MFALFAAFSGATRARAQTASVVPTDDRQVDATSGSVIDSALVAMWRWRFHDAATDTGTPLRYAVRRIIARMAARATSHERLPKPPCEVAIFLNGVRTTLDWVYTIPSEELDAIDIYATMVRMPFARREPDSTCGAMLFWTTRGIPGWQPQPGE